MPNAPVRRSSISVAMPVYNERRTIREIISRVKAVDREKEILVVDDGSSDGTRRILKEYDGDPEVRVVLQPQNRGKGAALQKAFEMATKDVVIVQDADLEYSPDDYEVLLGPIDSNLADVVYGSRFLHGVRRVLYFRHSIGNRVLTLLSNLFTDLNLTDMETCYKAFKREIIQNIELSSERFGFEPEITAKLAKLPCTIYEVPVNYYGRAYAQGKKITWRDGVAALWHIVFYALSRRHFVKDMAALERVLVNPPEAVDTGLDTLEGFEWARQYNRWIFDRFSRYIGCRVLEVGSGVGNIAAELLKRGGVESVVATDVTRRSLEILRDRLGDDDRISFAVWDANEAPPGCLGNVRVDTVICCNVLEHIEQQERALRSMYQLLEPGGCLLLLVPAQPWLYCGLDRHLGHFRRYARKDLREVVQSAGFRVEAVLDHNFVGILGWFWRGKILRKARLTKREIRWFDRLVPVLKPLDPLLRIPVGGISLIVVARK